MNVYQCDTPTVNHTWAAQLFVSELFGLSIRDRNITHCWSNARSSESVFPLTL